MSLLRHDYIVLYERNDPDDEFVGDGKSTEYRIIRKVENPAQAVIDSRFRPSHENDTIKVWLLAEDVSQTQFDVASIAPRYEWRSA